MSFALFFFALSGKLAMEGRLMLSHASSKVNVPTHRKSAVGLPARNFIPESRNLRVGSLDDFFGFANEIGVPNRQTLNAARLVAGCQRGGGGQALI